jgi:hypothetical protein
MDTTDNAGPPIGRTLFGPSKVGHDLVMFGRMKGDNLAGKIHECLTYATGTNIDSQEKILGIEGHRAGDWWIDPV